MFFPFDPYLLRRSARFLSLDSSYNTWGRSRQGTTAASNESSDDELEVPEGRIANALPNMLLSFVQWQHEDVPA